MQGLNYFYKDYYFDKYCNNIGVLPMKSILEEIIKESVKKSAVVEGIREEIDSYKHLVYHRAEPGMDNGYYILCRHPEELRLELERGGQDVSHDPKAWDYYNEQEAEFTPGAQFGTFECYDILDTKTNKKMNAKSYKNKKKALGRVETANIAHGTPRYKLQTVKLTEAVDMAFTPQYKARAEKEWSKIAGEPVTVEGQSIDGPLYAFGSELACLRLYHKMMGKGRTAYSKNRDSWYYCNK